MVVVACKSRKKSSNVKISGRDRSTHRVDNNILGLPQKLASGEETVATQKTEQKSEENDEKKSSNPSSGEDDDDNISERVKKRKLAVEELALKMEARILKAEKTLAKIKKWKSRRIHTKNPFTA